MKSDFSKIRSLVSRISNSSLRSEIDEELDNLSRSFHFYKDGFLNGRDSDDARGCKPCENDPRAFIMLDLEEGL